MAVDFARVIRALEGRPLAEGELAAWEAELERRAALQREARRMVREERRGS